MSACGRRAVFERPLIPGRPDGATMMQRWNGTAVLLDRVDRRTGRRVGIKRQGWISRSDALAAAIGFLAVTILGFDNGGYFEPSWRFAILAFLAVAGLALVFRNDVVFGRVELIFLGALVALAVWTLSSMAWGIAGTEAAKEAERTLVYVAGGAALLAMLERTAIRALLTGIFVGTVTLAFFGLGDRLLAAPSALNPYEGALLVEPLGYANALGIIVAIGLVIGVGLLVSERRSRTISFTLAAMVVLAVALALTSSRGAWLSLGCGLVAFALVRPRRRARHKARLWIVLGAAVCIAIPVWLALARTSGLGDRPEYWRVAAADARAYPLGGSGAGSFDDYWYRHATIQAGVQDAHSLYLETLAELGLLGFVLLLGVLVPPLLAACRARSDPNAAIAAAGYITFLIHAGLDWDWEMPATTLTGLACAAALLVSARSDFTAYPRPS